MAAETTVDSGKVDILEAEKQRYSDRAAVRAKWLSQYGQVDLNGDYHKNKKVLSELFNLVDIVAALTIDRELKNAKRLEDVTINDRVNQQWEYKGRVIYFRHPRGFSERLYVLYKLGYHMPEGLKYDTRFLRNDITHGSETVLAQYVNLDYDTVMAQLDNFGKALCILGMLDETDLTPSFEELRVREGSELCGGAYTIGALVGEGGMSRVYQGYQKNLGRKVAIKELKPDQFVQKTIQNECSALVKLRHPRIPQIIDTFSQNMTYYIVMEFIEGRNLDRFGGASDLPVHRRVSVVYDLCDILAYLHSKDNGMIYCDLKPENIMIDGRGSAYLIDFGISKQINAATMQNFASVGYTAPEVLLGRPASLRSDIFALGKLIEFLFYDGGSSRLKDLVACATNPDPERRFISVDAVRAALDHLELSDFSAAIGAEQERQDKKRTRLQILLAALSFAATAAAIILILILLL